MFLIDNLRKIQQCLFVLLLQCAPGCLDQYQNPSLLQSPYTFCSSYFFMSVFIFIGLPQFSPTIRWAAVIPATQLKEESLRRAISVSSLSWKENIGA